MVTKLIDQNAAEIISLDFRNAFNKVCLPILKDKVEICGLDKSTSNVNSKLNGPNQRVISH